MTSLEKWVLKRRADHWFAHNKARYEFFELIASLFGHDDIDEEEYPPAPEGEIR